jgi:hypothetical protein
MLCYNAFHFLFCLQKIRMQDTIRRYRETCLREKGREPLLEPYHVVLARYEDKILK